VAQSEVLHLKGRARFEGRQQGDSQPMKCADRQTEDFTEDAQTPCSHPGRVEDWRRCSLGPAYLLLPVSVGSASLAEP
jgi:hypothetical protein